MRIVVLLFTLIFLASCANHQTVNQPKPNAISTTDSNTIELSQGNVSVYLTPIQTAEDVKKYYSQNLLAKNILPVHVFIKNTDVENEVDIKTDDIVFINPDNSRLIPIATDDVIKRARYSHGQTALWAVGFGIIGGAVSAANVSKANKVLAEDYQNKALTDVSVKPAESMNGSVFFELDKSIETLDDHSLEIAFFTVADVQEIDKAQVMDGEIDNVEAVAQDNETANAQSEAEIPSQDTISNHAKVKTTLSHVLKGEVIRKDEKEKEPSVVKGF